MIRLFFYILPDRSFQINVEHFKITGGDHTWPDNPFGGNGVNKDINGSIEVWEFFSQYDINGLITTTAVEEKIVDTKIKIFPNPSATAITISLEDIQEDNYQLTSATGKIIQSGTIDSRNYSLNLAHLPTGVYFLKVGTEVTKILKN